MAVPKTNSKPQTSNSKEALRGLRFGVWSLNFCIWLSRVFCGLCLAFGISSCVPSTRPTVKIGLVAPFEGRYREIGEEVIYSARLAMREANASGGLGGYSVELMALDDDGDPAQAAEQARKLATDPQVVGVIGDWLDSTTVAAAPVLDEAGIPFLATTIAADLPATAFRLWLTESAYLAAAPDSLHCPLPCDDLETLDWLLSPTLPHTHTLTGPPLWGLRQFPRLAPDAAEGIYFIAPAPLPANSTDPTFADRYRAVSPGVEPRFLAVLAYDAAEILFSAIERDAQAAGKPTRAGVAAALATTDYSGLSGRFTFDADHNWTAAEGWLYQWHDGTIIKP